MAGSKLAPRRKAAAAPMSGGGGSNRAGRGGAAAASVGGRPTVKAVAAHLGSGSVVRSSGSEKSVREVGTEWLTDVSITSSTVSDSVVFNWWVSPTNVSARIAAIARQWERWMPHKLAFRFVSMVPATQAGSLTMWHDPDVDDETPSAPVVATAFASDSFVSGNVWESFNLPVKRLDDKTLLYTRDRGAGEADDRLEYAGQLYAAYTGPTVAATTILGRILFEYDIEFSKRCWEDSPSISSGPSFDPITTTATFNLVEKAVAAAKLITDNGISVGAKGIEIKQYASKIVRVVANMIPIGSGAASGTFRAVLHRAADSLEAFPSMYSIPGDYYSVSAGTAGLTYPLFGRNAVAYSEATGINETVIQYSYIYNSLPYPVYLDWQYTWGATAGSAGSVTGCYINMVDVDEISGTALVEHATLVPATGTSTQTIELVWSTPEPMACLPKFPPGEDPSGFTVVTAPARTAGPTVLVPPPSARGSSLISRLVG